jgi:hypothetical protein
MIDSELLLSLIVYYASLLFYDFDKNKDWGNINAMSFVMELSFIMELRYGSFYINIQVKFQDKMKNAAAGNIWFRVRTPIR